MEYILATICYGDLEEDLKVPAFVPISELICAIDELYDADARTLHAEPRGIILDKSKTLAEQSIEHGAKLTLN